MVCFGVYGDRNVVREVGIRKDYGVCLFIMLLFIVSIVVSENVFIVFT